MAWQILDFPMPPSHNRLNLNSSRGPRRCRFNSPEYKAFLHDCSIFEMMHRTQLSQIKAWAKDKPLIRIHCDYFFLRNKLYCLDGRIKKFDPPNREKATFDAVAKLLSIDDSVFRVWSGATHVGRSHFVNITLMDPLDDSE